MKRKRGMPWVYRINDYYWWVAHTLKTARRDYRVFADLLNGESPEDHPRALTPEEMDTLMYESEDGEKMSFGKRLELGQEAFALHGDPRLQLSDVFAITDW